MRFTMLGRLREAASISGSPALARATDDAVEVTDCPDCEDGVKDGGICPTCDGASWLPAMGESALTAPQRRSIPKAKFVFPEKAPGPGSYPIENLAHADDALARAKGTADEAAVKTAVYRDYPQLKESGAPEQGLVDAMGAEIRRLREGTEMPLEGGGDTKLRLVKTSDGREGYAVTLIREGKGNSADKRWYTREGVRELVDSGRAEGMQAYANHPPLDEEESMPERDVKQLVGTYADVKLAESAGVAQAQAVLVPIKGPGYEWMETLAEAATSHSGPKPLCGISLYGGCAGEWGQRPDGTMGEMATRIYPTSGDVVTNAGAGGEFHRRLAESARQRRLLREPSTTERKPMKLEELQAKQRDVAARLREADTPEKQAALAVELEELAGAEIDGPAASLPETLGALAESQPALAQSLREAARAEVAPELEQAQAQVREGQRLIGETDSMLTTLTVLKECDVTSPVDIQWFTGEVKLRGLREAADVKAFVENQLERDRLREAATLAALSGVSGGVEGNPGRGPGSTTATSDGGAARLREAGIPIKEPAAA